MIKQRIDQTIFRVAHRHLPYSQLGNAMLRDNRVSFEARGLLAFILSHPPNWRFSFAWLCQTTGLGRDKAQRMVRELEKFGYCNRPRTRKSDGTLGCYDYTFTDDPGGSSDPQPEKAVVVGDDAPDFTTTARPVAGQPAVAEPAPTKEGQSKKKNTNTPTEPMDGGGDRIIPFQETDPATLKGGVSPTADTLLGEAGNRLIPFDAILGASVIEQAREAAAASRLKLDGDKKRLPFTAKTLAAIGLLCVDRERLIKRYFAKTKQTKVADPNAYLLTMAREMVAKRDGVSVEIVAAMADGDAHTRASAMAATLGEKPEPPEWQKRLPLNSDRSALMRTNFVRRGA